MQALTVDVFLSVDGWASGATSPGYFGYHGPELEEWITAEVALPQLVVLGRRTYEALANTRICRDEVAATFHGSKRQALGGVGQRGPAA